LAVTNRSLRDGNPSGLNDDGVVLSVCVSDCCCRRVRGLAALRAGGLRLLMRRSPRYEALSARVSRLSALLICPSSLCPMPARQWPRLASAAAARPRLRRRSARRHERRTLYEPVRRDHQDRCRARQRSTDASPLRGPDVRIDDDERPAVTDEYDRQRVGRRQILRHAECGPQRCRLLQRHRRGGTDAERPERGQYGAPAVPIVRRIPRGGEPRPCGFLLDMLPYRAWITSHYRRHAASVLRYAPPVLTCW
jgi:hypothetical protein